MSIFRVSMVTTGAVAVIIGVGVGFLFLVDMDFHIAAHGSVEPLRVLPVRIRGGGLVEAIVEVGPVKKDDPLISISSNSTREALQLVGEQLALIQAEIDKERGELGSPQRRFTLGNSLADLKREAARLRSELKNAVVRAPFSGTVIATHAQRGEYLPAGESLVMILADDSQYVFRGEVTPESRAELHLGQRVDVRIDAYPHMRFGGLQGRVELVEGVFKDGAIGSYRLTIGLNQPYPYDLHMALGGSADVVVFHGTALDYIRREGTM